VGLDRRSDRAVDAACAVNGGLGGSGLTLVAPKVIS
jgi:hypothetical protein